MRIHVEGQGYQELREQELIVGLLVGVGMVACLLGLLAVKPPEPEAASPSAAVPAVRFFAGQREQEDTGWPPTPAYPPARGVERDGQSLVVRPFVWTLREDEALELTFEVALEPQEGDGPLDLVATAQTLQLEVGDQGVRLVSGAAITRLRTFVAARRSAAWPASLVTISGSIAIEPDGHWQAALGGPLQGMSFGALGGEVAVRLRVAICTRGGRAGPLLCSPWLRFTRGAVRPRLRELARHGIAALAACDSVGHGQAGRMLEAANGDLVWQPSGVLDYCRFDRHGTPVEIGRPLLLFLSGAGCRQPVEMATALGEMGAWPGREVR